MSSCMWTKRKNKYLKTAIVLGFSYKLQLCFCYSSDSSNLFAKIMVCWVHEILWPEHSFPCLWYHLYHCFLNDPCPVTCQKIFVLTIEWTFYSKTNDMSIWDSISQYSKFSTAQFFGFDTLKNAGIGNTKPDLKCDIIPTIMIKSNKDYMFHDVKNYSNATIGSSI